MFKEINRKWNQHDVYSSEENTHFLAFYYKLAISRTEKKNILNFGYEYLFNKEMIVKKSNWDQNFNVNAAIQNSHFGCQQMFHKNINQTRQVTSTFEASFWKHDFVCLDVSICWFEFRQCPPTLKIKLSKTIALLLTFTDSWPLP